MTDATQHAGWRQTYALGALIVSALAVVWFMAAALGTKFGLWSYQFGLGRMYFAWGQYVVGLAALGAASALVISLIAPPRKQPFILALGALLIAGLLAGRLFGLGANAQGLPPIHDVQTDWDRPVTFSDTLLDTREAAGATNDVLLDPVVPEGLGERQPAWAKFSGKSNAEAQAMAIESENYEPIAPLVLDDPARAVFDQALALVERRGWDVVAADPEAGVIEATETSFWFGFKDDVAIHVRDVDDRTRVDMRSVSRVGLSDLGANQRRIHLFLQDLNASL